MPRNFSKRGNISVISLLKEIGFFDQYSCLREEDIFYSLIQNPECVSDWIQWSDDQRSDQRWYFLEKESQYHVGFWSEKETIDPISFNDKNQACAFFIMRYLNGMIKYA